MKYLRLSLQLSFLMFGTVAKSEIPEGVSNPEEDFATREVRESLQRYAEALAGIESIPPDEVIPKLSEMMVRTSRWQNEKSMTVYKSAQQKLLSIPDHAKYFTDKIEESWKSNAERVRLFESQPEWKAALDKSEETSDVSEGMFNLIGRMWGDYEETCTKNLGILGHLPSTESVRALGHYLRERDEPDIRIDSPGTGFAAAKSLTGLISDGPAQTWRASWEDVPKWQKWFDDVKAGKRTFRFVGSDVDYTLDGPADERIRERIRNRNSGMKGSMGMREDAVGSVARTATPEKGPVFRWSLLAAILLCVAALATFLMRGRRNRN